MKHEEKDSYEDLERGFSGGSAPKITYKDIVLQHLQKCVVAGSREMSAGGGVMQRMVDGQLIEVPVPDTREIFINHVKQLNIILTPQLAVHEEAMKPSIDSFKLRLKEIENIRLQEIEKLEAAYKEKDKHKVAVEFNSNLKHIHNLYEAEKAMAYQDLLKGMCILLSKMQFFEEAGNV